MYLIKSKKISMVLLVLVIFFGFQQVHGITNDQLDNYRVRIHTAKDTTTIRANNGYSINIDGVNAKYILNQAGENITFTKSGDKIKVTSSNGTVIGEGSEIKLLKKDNTVRYFEIKGIDNVEYAKYPDNVIVRLDSKKTTLNIINSTPLESYLKGVIPYEIGASAPLEAMKAQAVTARTLAVKRVNKHNIDGYDITNTTSDQVYKGYNATYFASTHNVSKAVEQTKGVVLSYNGSLIEGIYYSNNGGQTANDGFVWSSGSSTPYYVSKEDTYDTYLHRSSVGWGKIDYTETYTKDQLRKLIIDNSVKYPAYYKPPYSTPAFNGLSEDYNIEILSQTNGYITQVRLSDDQGRSYILKNYASRWFFGLRSQQYKLTRAGGLFIKSKTKTNEKDTVYVKGADGVKREVNKSDIVIKSASSKKGVEPIKYVFNGRGYGHGIGMSQNGAMNRADAGHSYKKILEFYYDGTKTISNYGNK